MNDKMIEEMASDMNFACIELSKEQRLEIARVLINLDYCKIPEGSVVLTEMQYNALLSKQSTVISIDEQLKKEFEYELKQARKETAEKTIKWFKENSVCIPSDEDINEFAKQFGVEVEV